MGVALLNDEFKKALKRSSLDQLLAGIASGIVSTSLLHPLDLVKTQFQVDQSSRSTLMKAPFLYTFRHLHAQLKAFGVRSGLYRGLSANLLGAASSWGIYFYLYDCAKKMFPTDHYGHRAPIQNFVASGSASAMTVLITNPVWLVKTRLCTQNPLDPLRYTGFFNALRRIFQEEGVSGWYRGLVPGLFGISHGAVQFMIYEELKKHYKKNVLYFRRPLFTILVRIELFVHELGVKGDGHGNHLPVPSSALAATILVHAK